jgi:DNA-binding CsgD family transcriptional regulator/CheY-like chemotaxis protein
MDHFQPGTRIAPALGTNFATIRTIDQLGILLDYWAFGQSGYAPVPDYLELARADPLVWIQIAGTLHDIDALYRDAPGRDAFRKFARGLLQPIAARLGWEPRPNEETNDGRLRSTVLESLARLADAVEFLTKPFRDQELFAAVRQALLRDGEFRKHRSEVLELRERLGTLTPRERQVLTLVVAGLLNKQIAGELGTTELTIKVHRGRVMRKMQAASLADLVRMAEKLGISPA